MFVCSVGDQEMKLNESGQLTGFIKLKALTHQNSEIVSSRDNLFH